MSSEMSAERDVNADIAEALHAVAKQLKDLSDRLPPAASVQPDPVKESEDDLDYKLVVEREEGWETVRDTLKEEDKETIDSWKDELGNLLVFAGLFSAVVTAFTVESYTWLQQDPGDASNQLLAHMSVQLANSSTPALPLQNVTSSFSPAGIAVPVNTLWVLSLTLSLISAFFAIAVQQWLRQLRLPGDLPIRRAVQLQALRSDGLKMWQVPSIISLLPLLLQIAVILFLAGLFLLLQSLNTTVTTAFAAVAGIALSIFLVTAFIPLITIRCPYKSPLVPTVLIVLQWLSYPLAALSLAIILITFWVLLLPLRLLRWRIPIPRGYIMRFLDWFFGDEGYVIELLEYVMSFGSHMFVDMGQFWLHRECRHIFNLGDDDTVGLEQSSSIRVLLSIRSESFAKVAQCWPHFASSRWIDVFVGASLRSLCAIVPGIGSWDLIRGRRQARIMLYVREWLSVRHHRLGLMALRRRDWAHDGEVSLSDSVALTLVHKLDNAVSGTSQKFVNYLLHVCDNQRICGPYSWETVPAYLLFDVTQRDYVPDEYDAQTIVTVAHKHSALIPECGEDAIRLRLASSTSASVAMSLHPSLTLAEGVKVLDNLANYLCNNKTKDTLKEMLRKYYKDRSKTWEPRSIPPMILRLCQALVTLAEIGSILQSSDCPSIRLTEALREICTGFDQGDIKTAQDHLDEFTQIIPDWDLGWRARERLGEGRDGYLDALMLAERFREEWYSDAEIIPTWFFTPAEDNTTELVAMSAQCVDSTCLPGTCDMPSGSLYDHQAGRQDGSSVQEASVSSAGSRADDEIADCQDIVDQVLLHLDADGQHVDGGTLESHSRVGRHDSDNPANPNTEDIKILAQLDEPADDVPSPLNEAAMRTKQ